MEPEQFIELALRTESNNFPEIVERLANPKNIRLLHAAMGLCTEANEFLDAMKKFIFYGKPIDEVNLAEEIGDSDWYKAIACDVLDKSFEEIWAAVINKLAKRYGGDFNIEGAINRDLGKERSILENSLNTKEPEFCEQFQLTLTNEKELLEVELPKALEVIREKEEALDCLEGDKNANK